MTSSNGWVLRPWKRRLRDAVNTLANALNVHVLSRDEYSYISAMFLTEQGRGPPLSEAARSYLRIDNPRLLELRERYRAHPAAAHTQWNERDLLSEVDLQAFRRDNFYVWQTRGAKPETYLITAYHLRETDALGLFGVLTEDELFGAVTVPFEHGYLVSRDLLDSINELNLIARWLGCGRDSAVSLLDIGAGYGRLAHRLVSSFPNATIVCVDAVAVSTFLCEFYLDFRKLGERAEAVTLDRAAEQLAGREFDLVTNIHSFSECPASSIEWWLECLDTVRVGSLLIVPNDGDRLLSKEANGTRLDFGPLLERHGWRPVRQEPVYSSDVALRFALFPGGYFRLFAR
ncbi:MAG: putative sugar O-methyltransferase [Stellaceae bacterium]